MYKKRIVKYVYSGTTEVRTREIKCFEEEWEIQKAAKAGELSILSWE